MKPRRHRILAILGLAVFCQAWPGVSLPAVFSDHMVLQRNQRVPVWGTADPGELITVEFKGKEYTAVADSGSAWMVRLDPMAASAEPAVMTVRGENRIEIRDILVGEVWLCSGQSNMEKPLGEQKGQRPTENYEAEIAAANYPDIRLYQVPKYGRVNNPDWQMRWLPCSPQSLSSSRFSAVGYFFSQALHERTGIPVGIIHASFGGTMIEAWTPEFAFRQDPVLAPLLYREYFAWVDEVQATDLYRLMIEPLVPYGLHGFLWYQGEANAMYAETSVYARKMQALINSWRTVFVSPDAPFLFVQLAPFNYSEWDKFPRQLTPEALPLFWEVQSSVLNLPGTGMVVTTDLAGDARDIHPVRKKEIGQRLAYLAFDYIPELKDSAPHPRSPFLSHVIFQDSHAILDFSTTDGGLRTRQGKKAGGFLIAGPDRVFHPASAIVKGTLVQLFSAQVEHPVAVRFAWNETSNPNLVSHSGLPVTPFRTDNWPVQNEKTAP